MQECFSSIGGREWKIVRMVGRVADGPFCLACALVRQSKL
jgi:hypothetical protein